MFDVFEGTLQVCNKSFQSLGVPAGVLATQDYMENKLYFFCVIVEIDIIL